jgi:hypothetical protein
MVLVTMGSSSLLQDDKLIMAPDAAANKILLNVLFIVIKVLFT